MSQAEIKAPPLFWRGQVAHRLIDRLLAVEVGQLVTYEELSAACGHDVTQVRGPLDTARRAVENEHGRAFGTVRGEGLKRLPPGGTIDSIPATLDHIKRTARRKVRQVTRVEDFATLPNDKKLAGYVGIAQLGAIAQASSRDTRKQLEAAGDVRQIQEVIEQTLKAVK